MTYFILKHKATGKVMPALMRGSTWWEPNENSKSPPRLFASRQAASSASRWWTSGQWREERIQSNWESFDYDDSQMVRIEPTRLRKPGDLEIVEVELKEIGQMELI